MKILKNYLYNISYQLFALIVPLVTTPYVTRVLGVEGVGINAYTNSIIQYFLLAGSIGVSLYGNRIIAFERDDKQKMSDTFWSLTILRGITIALAALVFLIFWSLTDKYKMAYLGQAIQLIAAAADISWLFMGIEDFRKTVIRNFVVKLISTLSIFVLVKGPDDVVIYIMILSISTLLGNVTMWGYLKNLVYRLDIHKLVFKKHLMGSLRLFIPQIAIQIYLVLNKTMLGSIVGVRSAGLYENSDKIVKILLTLVTAISTVMMPRMANNYANRNYEKLRQHLYDSLDFVGCISFLLTAGLAGVSKTFSVWFMGEQFAETGVLIPVLSLVCPLIAYSTVLGSQFLVTTEREKEFTIAVIAGAVSNILFNLILIPTLGVLGAVIATVLSEALVTGVDFVFVSKYANLNIMIQGAWKYLLASVVVYGVVRFENLKMPGTFTSLIFQTLTGVAVYLVMNIGLKSTFYLFTRKQIGRMLRKNRND